ncbi:MAG TPA: DUF1800 domain-containing protein, partial [Acidimicrobiales bacterium]|nr:DUF1800 domain-containing protein [Acidimicrobiales bacterium]
NRDESYASAGRISAAVEPGPTLVYQTAAEAAAATQVTVPTILDPARPAVHLLRRTTFGPTPELVAAVEGGGIDAWLAAQLDPASIPDPEGDAVSAAFPLSTADPAAIQGSVERNHWDASTDVSVATIGRQVWSQRQLFEVMVDFWANHLHVATPGPGSWDVGPAYHRDVIRRHALGTFTDMLLASGSHPAVLRFLTAESSTKEDVNENYGRELLELHTVGVAAGYTEADVRTSAHILTGRTVVGRDGPGAEGTFRYDPAKHFVGPVSVLGFSDPNASPDGGLDVGDRYLRHLAAHPATAATIAHKLAVRFVSDVPPPTLVDRLATAYLDGGTAVLPVLDVLFRSAEFWSAVGQKIRRPLENVVASARILGVRPEGEIDPATRPLYNAARRGGHAPLAWPAPNGYPDVGPAWRSANGVLEGWNTHRMLIGDWDDRLTRPNVRELAGGATTAGAFVDNLCSRLTFQAFQAPHRAAVVTFLGGEAAPLDRDDLADGAAALVLDSPYFALR